MSILELEKVLNRATAIMETAQHASVKETERWVELDVGKTYIELLLNSRASDAALAAVCLAMKEVESDLDE